MRAIIVCLFILASPVLFAQRGNHGGHPGRGHGHGPGHGHHKRAVVVKRSPYRPGKVVVYHPVWAPHMAYHRRWVYFPKRNLYWDNWRGHYVFWSGGVWISQPAPPAGISSNQLEKEKQKELKEEEDDVDDIYKSNETHSAE